MYWEGGSEQLRSGCPLKFVRDMRILWFKRTVSCVWLFVEYNWRGSLYCDAHAEVIQMIADGATALHIAADNGNLDVGTLDHSWLLMSSIMLRRCIHETFINFMLTMHFIHAAKYRLTDVSGFTKTAWVRLWRRSKLRIGSQYSMRQLKTIETASCSDYH